MLVLSMRLGFAGRNYGSDSDVFTFEIGRMDGSSNEQG